ncbi:MAG: TIGR02594 family protein [Hyphomicrobiaceae bacterium]|nr:TIGR02594 family protein [Hyphomicrobiaceae bacterium]
MLHPDWLERAWREFDVSEIRGSRHNPRILEMFKDVGHPGIVRDEVAWCAAFLGACLERTGRRSTRSLMARSYVNWGEGLEIPRIGAIAVLSRGRDPALGHVGFVVGETEDHLFLLGGNQSQRVSVDAFAKSRLIGLRWPPSNPQASNDHGKPPDAVPVVMRPVATAAADPPTVDGDERRAVANEESEIFDRALGHVLQMEGGYSDDPHDPGGPTNKGITLAVYARWVGEVVGDRTRARLISRLKRIPDVLVREIYWTRYWKPAGCRQMPPAVAMMHFDAAVNHGVTGAARLLQRALGVDVDGEIGPETRGALAKSDHLELLVRYAELRRERYRELRHFWRFGRGWLRRVDATLAQSSALISLRAGSPEITSAGHVEDNDDRENGNGDMAMKQTSETTVPDAKWWGQSMTIWGVLVTALATVLPAIGPLIGIDVTGEMVRQIGQQAVEIAQAIGGLVGTLLAIYGRIRATAPIERRLVSLKL